MGLFDNLESKLSSMVNGAFAKAFKSSVQPVEIASAIRTAMDDKAAVVGRGRTIVPNLYTIQLSPTDYDQLAAYSDSLTDELVAAAEDHADSQRYHPAGPVRVVLSQDPSLETGVFKLRPASAKDPFQRSYDAPQRPREAAAPREQASQAGRQPDHQHDRQDDPYAPGSAQVPGGVAEGGLASAYAPEELRHQPPAAQAPAAQQADERREAVEPAQPVVRQPGRPAAEPPQTPREDDDLGTTQVHEPAQPARPRTDPTRRPWLDIDGDRYPLLGAITVVGRDGVADIVLDDPGISRKHAEIRITNDGPHLVGSIRDLGSTNGTFVEGHRITSQRLADGDRITIGRTSFLFRLGKR